MNTQSEFTSEQKKMYADQVRRLKNTFSTGGCMFAGTHCAEQPIRSHTISRSRYLAHVSENNQVLQWSTDHWANDVLDVTDLKPLYANEATTFPGFCSQHDSSLFKGLDEDEFMATAEQLFMLAYRTHAREVHCKKAQILAFPQPEDVARLHGEPEPEKATHSLFGELNMQSMEVGQRDTLIHHGRLEQVLSDSDYRRLCSCVVPFKFPAQPFMASAGSFYPDFDVHGREVQDFGDALAVLNTIHYAILPLPSQSYAIFSFLDNEAHGPKQLIDSIVESERLGDLLAWMPFTYIENTVVRPTWWHNQSDTMKTGIRNAFRDNLDLTTPMSASISKCPATFTTGIIPSRPFWI